MALASNVVMRVYLYFVIVSLAALFACNSTPETVAVSHQAMESASEIIDFNSLDPLPLLGPESFVRAPWGAERGALSREDEGARTGPMAIAADPDGGLAILDTVGGRVLRYDGQGTLQATLPIGVETGDDLVVLPDRSLAVLAYRHAPTPGYDLLSFESDGTLRFRRPTPAAATMPTALLVETENDDATLLVENRHAAVHPVDGSPRRWGRPVSGGNLFVRVQLVDGGLVLLTARDRSGQLAWERSLEVPWRVTEILDLSSCDEYVALILRGIEPSHHETHVVAFDQVGTPLGTLALHDRRDTDAARPFTISRSGDIFALETNDEGATVLRYRNVGGVQ